MKIYRVCYYNESDSSQGFSYHRSKADAKKALAEFKKQEDTNFDGGRSCIDEFINVEISAKGIIYILDMCAAHPDNG